jgi:GTPase Era involved in 16S rRNA processing
MKTETVTSWMTEDGLRFYDELAALDHEDELMTHKLRREKIYTWLRELPYNFDEDTCRNIAMSIAEYRGKIASIIGATLDNK